MDQALLVNSGMWSEGPVRNGCPTYTASLGNRVATIFYQSHGGCPVPFIAMSGPTKADYTLRVHSAPLADVQRFAGELLRQAGRLMPPRPRR